MNDTVSTETDARSRRRTRYAWTACAILLVVLLDQFTKSLIIQHIPYGTSLEVIRGLFNICHTKNTGVVFGMFPGMPMIFAVLTAVAIVVLGVLVWTLEESTSWIQFVSYGLLIGGAIGNLIDRVRLQAVTDFLDFYLGTHHWPAFNVADSAVCIGVTLLLICTFFDARKEQPDVSA